MNFSERWTMPALDRHRTERKEGHQWHTVHFERVTLFRSPAQKVDYVQTALRLVSLTVDIAVPTVRIARTLRTRFVVLRLKLYGQMDRT